MSIIAGIQVFPGAGSVSGGVALAEWLLPFWDAPVAIQHPKHLPVSWH